jgi:hypothetical protein
MHKKSKKAFEHNVKVEMEAHPDKSDRKRNLAIAYSVQRKAKKASGGSVQSGSRDMNMADGGVMKPERYSIDQGTSAQGHAVRRGNRSKDWSKSPNASSPSIEREMSREDYAKAKSIQKSKPRLNSGGVVKSGSHDMDYADGGEVDKLRQGAQEARKYSAQREEKGVHAPRFPSPHSKESMGESYAGYTAKAESGREASFGGNTKEGKKPRDLSRQDMQNESKKEHRRVLEESRSMPKPKLQGLAEGGKVSASNERRPMPDNKYNDSPEVAHNKAKKALIDSDWTDNPTVKQAQKNNGREVKPIKYPRMVPSDAFSTRLRDEEDHLMESKSPGPYGEQPPEHDNEMSPKRQGPSVRDMADEHSTHRKPYKMEVEHDDTMDEAEEDMKRSKYAKGGQIEESDEHHPMDGKYEDDLQDLPPSEDEAESMAMSENEEGPDRQGDDVPDMEDEHSTGRKPYAGGGKIGDSEENIDESMEMNPAHDKHSADDSEDQPDMEEEIEHAASIAAAIMMKMRQKMFKGGAILEHRDQDDINSHDSIYSDDSDMADLNRNAEEDANEEDQLSFDSIKKENYSERSALEDASSPMDSAQHGDSEEMDSENKHDNKVVSAIRKKMKIKSPITR